MTQKNSPPRSNISEEVLNGLSASDQMALLQIVREHGVQAIREAINLRYQGIVEYPPND